MATPYRGGRRGEGRQARASKRLQCVVVTPEKTLARRAGRLGRAAGLRRRARRPARPHSADRPARLRRAPDKHKGETSQRYYVDGGFAQVRDDVVTVLTNRAIPAAISIDPAASCAELEKLRTQRAITDHEFAEKSSGLARARGMIRVGSRTGDRVASHRIDVLTAAIDDRVKCPRSIPIVLTPALVIRSVSGRQAIDRGMTSPGLAVGNGSGGSGQWRRRFADTRDRSGS